MRGPSRQTEAGCHSPAGVEENCAGQAGQDERPPRPRRRRGHAAEEARAEWGDARLPQMRGRGLLSLRESSKAYDATETVKRGTRSPFGASSLRDRDELSRQKRKAQGRDPNSPQPVMLGFTRNPSGACVGAAAFRSRVQDATRGLRSLQEASVVVESRAPAVRSPETGGPRRVQGVSRSRRTRRRCPTPPRSARPTEHTSGSRRGRPPPPRDYPLRSRTGRIPPMSRCRKTPCTG